jgi:hypothetical protein
MGLSTGQDLKSIGLKVVGHMPVIPTTQEAEAGGSRIQGQEFLLSFPAWGIIMTPPPSLSPYFILLN